MLWINSLHHNLSFKQVSEHSHDVAGEKQFNTLQLGINDDVFENCTF